MFFSGFSFYVYTLQLMQACKLCPKQESFWPTPKIAILNCSVVLRRICSICISEAVTSNNIAEFLLVTASLCF